MNGDPGRIRIASLQDVENWINVLFEKGALTDAKITDIYTRIYADKATANDADKSLFGRLRRQ